jgi:hypothetical protein
MSNTIDLDPLDDADPVALLVQRHERQLLAMYEELLHAMEDEGLSFARASRAAYNALRIALATASARAGRADR